MSKNKEETQKDLTEESDSSEDKSSACCFVVDPCGCYVNPCDCMPRYSCCC